MERNKYLRPRWLENFRMESDTFYTLLAMVETDLTPGNALFSTDVPVPADKRLAIFLDWVGSGNTYASLAPKYDIGKSTVYEILHEVRGVLAKKLVPNQVKFPTSDKLTATMQGFKKLCHLPFCVGALDGTFVKMKKPSEYGDTYFCYKKYTAIIVMAYVDAKGRFIYVKSGTPGMCGDAHTWNTCSLKDNLDTLLHVPAGEEAFWKLPGSDATWDPFIVADSAFALSNRVMKCYESATPTLHEFNFNCGVIRTRRVVENAFGRLKASFAILKDCNMSDPEVVAELANVCCALHNFIEATNETGDMQYAPGNLAAPFDPSNKIGVAGLTRAAGENRDRAALAAASTKRDILAEYMRNRLDVRPAIVNRSAREAKALNTALLNGPVGYLDAGDGNAVELITGPITAV